MLQIGASNGEFTALKMTKISRQHRTSSPMLVEVMTTDLA